MEYERKNSSRKLSDQPVRIMKLVEDPSYLPFVERIFFESSNTQDFASIADRNAFLARWLGRYLRLDRDNIFLAVAKDRELQGYLTGCLDSKASRDLYREFRFYDLFDPFIKTYPAHLHVNVLRRCRNKGVGAHLIDVFIDQCRQNSIPGVHVVTAPLARNVRFYRRCGFEPAARVHWEGQDLVLLGLDLA